MERISEDAWRDKVIETAHMWGWKVSYFRPCRTLHGWRTAVGADGKGWPDLTLVHLGRHLVLFRELKAEDGKLDRDQDRWLKCLREAGADAAVWYPHDWPAVAELLSDGRMPPGEPVTQGSVPEPVPRSRRAAHAPR